MGTTAEKLTYLNDTKQLLKENINNLGGNLTNEPFRQYASVLEGIYERIPKVSGIGASLSLSPSMVGKIKLNEIQGDTLQNGTPTPSSPVPIQSVTGLQNVGVCGKNLFNKNNANIENGGWISLDGKKGNGGDNKLFYIKIQPNTTYTIQKIAGNRFRVGTYQNNNIPNGTKFNVFQINDSSTSITITSGSNDNYLYVQYLAGDTNEQQLLDSIQIEIGSTATTYEQYKGNTYEVNLGNIELNKIGDYKDSIKKSNGKNLFDSANANLINAYVDTTITSNANSKTLYIPCENNTTYTISRTLISGRFAIATTNELPTSGTTTYNRINNNSATSLTLTSDNNSKYIVVWYYNANNTGGYTEEQLRNSIMINEGSTALPYEPYGKVWYRKKNIGKVVLNGSENWTNFTTVTGSSNTMSQIDLPMQFLNRDGYTDRFPVIPDYSATEHFVIAGGLTHLYVHILNSRLSTLDVAGFKSWLASNITTFYYVLKTPIYEVITNTELIEDLETLYTAKSHEGTTNIEIISENLEMIVNVGVLKGE